MSIYKEFISTLIEKLIDLGYLKEKLVGAEIKVINKIERNFKIKLPELYKEFLLQMDFNGAGEGLDDYFHLGISDKFYTQRVANEILKYDKSKYYPLKNKLVITSYGEYLFNFIPTDFGDNPPVYHYEQGQSSKLLNSLKSLETEEIIEKRVKYEALYGIEISKMFFKDLYYLNGTIHYESFSEYLISLIYNRIAGWNEDIYADIKPVKGDGSCWCWDEKYDYYYTYIQNQKEYLKKENAIKKEFEYISTALRKIIPKNSEIKL